MIKEKKNIARHKYRKNTRPSRDKKLQLIKRKNETIGQLLQKKMGTQNPKFINLRQFSLENDKGVKIQKSIMPYLRPQIGVVYSISNKAEALAIH